MSTVQLFRREALNFARFDEIDRQHRDANIDSIFYYAVFYPAIEAISALASALIIWYGGASVIDGTLTLGALVAFLQYSQRFFRPISDMSEKFNVLQSAMASSERIFKLLDEPVAIAVAGRAEARARSAERRRGHIAFDHVWFAYNDADGRADWVLRDVSFEVKPGERRRHRRRHRVGQDDADQPAAAVLRRAARPHHGRRRRHPRARSRRPARAVQPRPAGRAPVFRHDRRQHPAGQRGDRRRAGARARRAAVHADAFIERLPGGYAAPVAERGATLSVGQKQLLSFARALAFDPRVLILDEATSSVDTETELLIRDALRGADGRPDDDRHRAPAVDDPGHGQDSGAAQGRACASRARTRSCWPRAGSTSSCSSCSTRTKPDAKPA